MPQNAHSRAIIERLHGNRQGMCQCPCHDDRTPSLHVTGKEDGKVLLFCHAGCSQEDLVTWCKEHGLWHVPMGRVINFRPVNEQLRQRLQQREDSDEQQEQEEQEEQDEQQQEPEEEQDEQQQEPEDSDYARFRIAWYVLRMATAHKLANPDARKQLLPYLNGRGLKAVPAGAMYLPSEIVSQIIRDYPECDLRYFPAMMQATCDAKGRLRGALITQLTKDGKANLRLKDGKSVRRIVGPSKHAFVQVTPRWPTVDRPLLAAEGVEKAAAVAQLLKEEDYPAIATLGVANMRNNMPLPPCAEVIIAADNGAAGSNAAEAMAGHIKRAGGIARIVFPPEQFKDWDAALKAADGDTLASYREMFLSAPPFDGTDADEDTGKLAPTVAEVLKMEIPPLDYLLEPWLTTSSIGETHAQRGVGKTRFMMGVGHALASGQNFLHWRVKRPVRVLYVDGELPGALLQKRLQLLGAPSDNLRLVSRDLLLRQNVVLPDLGSLEGRDFLDRIIEAQQSEVMILDSLSTLIYSGKEVDPEDWMPIQQWLMGHRFRKRAIIFLHHEGWKAGQARGTSKREDVIDYTLGLEAKNSNSDDEVCFQINFGKKRELYGKDAASLLVHLTTNTDITQWRHEFARDHTEQVAELQRQEMKQVEIAKTLGISTGQVSKIVKKLAQAAGAAAAPANGGRGGREG